MNINHRRRYFSEISYKHMMNSLNSIASTQWCPLAYFKPKDDPAPPSESCFWRGIFFGPARKMRILKNLTIHQCQGECQQAGEYCTYFVYREHEEELKQRRCFFTRATFCQARCGPDAFTTGPKYCSSLGKEQKNGWRAITLSIYFKSFHDILDQKDWFFKKQISILMQNLRPIL